MKHVCVFAGLGRSKKTCKKCWEVTQYMASCIGTVADNGKPCIKYKKVTVKCKCK